MKTLLLAAGVVAATSTPLLAQSAPPQRADIHVVSGWQNLHRAQPQQSYNDWMNGIFYGGAGAGWYWSDHLKTQIDFGAGTRGRQYRYETIVVNGNLGYQSSRLSISQQSLALGQQFQFFRNAWFHPYVGAGVDLAHETIKTELESSSVYDPVTRTYRPIVPSSVGEPESRFVARPFVETGLKGYVTRRAFFIADARLKFRSQVDEVLFRFGFGVDF